MLTRNLYNQIPNSLSKPKGKEAHTQTDKLFSRYSIRCFSGTVTNCFRIDSIKSSSLFKWFLAIAKVSASSFLNKSWSHPSLLKPGTSSFFHRNSTHKLYLLATYRLPGFYPRSNFIWNVYFNTFKFGHTFLVGTAKFISVLSGLNCPRRASSLTMDL